MKALHFVAGDVTDPVGERPIIVAHVCNNVGAYGAGVAAAIRSRWPEAASEYFRWHRAEIPDREGGTLTPPELGQVQLVRVGEKRWVANMIAQHGIGRRGGAVPLRYGALETCLSKVAKLALRRGAEVHLPRIGTGLAGGNWEKVEEIIHRTLLPAGVRVVVYDFAPLPERRRDRYVSPHRPS